MTEEMHHFLQVESLFVGLDVTVTQVPLIFFTVLKVLIIIFFLLGAAFN